MKRSTQQSLESAAHRTRWTLLVLPLVAQLFASSTQAGTTTPVVCTGGVVNDRFLIQTAIDNSANGDTIELIGTCQLDGTAIFINTSNLTIEGPGAAGNWTTVVSGLTSSGIPLGDGPLPPFSKFNRGFSIGPSGNSISGVIIQGIKFVNLNVAVDISPSISGNFLLCSALQITSGSASDVSVANNWFDNDRRAVSNFGLSDHVNITDNHITNSGYSGTDILSEGGFFGCRGGSPLSIQFPTNVNYQNNVVKNDHARVPIFVQTVQSATIIKNTITGGGNIVAPILLAAQKAYVSQNEVDGNGLAFAGIFDNQPFLGVAFPTLDHHLTNNSVTNNAFIGIGVDSGVFGTSIINNHFDASGVVNILLCDANANTTDLANLVCDGGGVPSHNNTVITTDFITTVFDLGVENKLVGTQNILNAPTVPVSVQANLINAGVGGPQLP